MAPRKLILLAIACSVVGALVPLGMFKLGLLPKQERVIETQVEVMPSDEDLLELARAIAAESPALSPAANDPAETIGREAATVEEVYMVGYIQLGDRVNVTLSDGRTITEADRMKLPNGRRVGMIARLDRSAVTLADGTKYWMRMGRKGSERPPFGIEAGQVLENPEASAEIESPSAEGRNFL